MNNETICALATAPGGALGIIRVSGAQSLDILSSIFTKVLSQAQPNAIHYGHIVEHDAVSHHQSIIDEVLVSVFRSPHSYTGEDSAEISCHGSRYILNKVLELLVKKGCRMAAPGEFTMRAYLNGKLDLSQAEAVADLIASTNKATHDVAMNQLRGGISSELKTLRDKLLKLTSLIELELDFSDHEDLEFADRSELLALAQHIEVHIAHLAHTFETGQALKQGIPVAIVGKTNVGKSTLLNRLVGDDRAIVSDIHGTTRDTIEETMEIQGVQFRFIDTAGIRNTVDEVEKIGIDRAYQAINKARIVLWLFDETPTETEAEDITKRCAGKVLIPVLNKVDLASDNTFLFSLSSSQLIRISAKYGTNLQVLRQAVYDAAGLHTLSEGDVIISNARHYDILLRAHEAIQRVLDGIQLQLSGDLLSEDLRQVLNLLSEITGGQITPQETLNHIFSHFCVGK